MTKTRRLAMSFDDNQLVPLLYGEHDMHLARIEHALGVSLASRGNHLTVSGPDEAVGTAQTVLQSLWQRLERGLAVDSAAIGSVIDTVRRGTDGGGESAAELAGFNRPDQAIVTPRRQIAPRTVNQARYVAALREHPLVFGLGPAGTGKTYLAVAHAVTLLTRGEVDRIILSRPAVEAGERLGFLPGDMREKVDPYLRPLYDALHDMLRAEQVTRYIDNGVIEIAPLAFMRGRTLSNAFAILDEAQNSTSMQMRMFLTRMGENSRMAVTGDISQIDLPPGQRSGLRDALDILRDIAGVGFVDFTDRDVLRHPLVTEIVRAYGRLDAGKDAAVAEPVGPGHR